MRSWIYIVGARGWRWIDRQLAINRAYGSCSTPMFCRARSLWHVKTGRNWANAISKALHLTEGAAWHKCQWRHSPPDWQEKIRQWCWLRVQSSCCCRESASKDCFGHMPEVQPGSWFLKNLSLTSKLWPRYSRQFWESSGVAMYFIDCWRYCTLLQWWYTPIVYQKCLNSFGLPNKNALRKQTLK